MSVTTDLGTLRVTKRWAWCMKCIASSSVVVESLVTRLIYSLGVLRLVPKLSY